MKEEIIRLCELIKENLLCVGCGAVKQHDGSCKHCGAEDLEFKSIVDSLVKYLSNCQLDEDILLSLYSIRFLNCTEVHFILNNCDYNKFINNKIVEVRTKLFDIFMSGKNNEISNLDCKYLIYFLENNLIEEKDLYSVTNFMYALLMCKKIELTLEQKFILVKHFTQTYMKTFYPNISGNTCIFEKMVDSFGSSFFNQIVLDEDKVTQCLENEKYIELLELIFHECTHTLQKHQMSNIREASYMNLLNVKEFIIKRNIEDYYDQNYYVCSLEVHARYMAYNFLLQFARQFGWESTYKEYSEKGMEKESMNFLFEQRKLNGHLTTVDMLFDSLKLDSSILNQFPALNFEYKQGEEHIIRKTKEEIEQDYLDYLKKYGDSEEAHYLFNTLINKYKNEEKVWFNK